MTQPIDLLTSSSEPGPGRLTAKFPRLLTPKLPLVAFRDATDERHDPLTHMVNRSLLVHRLEQAAQDTGDMLAVLFVNVDRFRTINTNYGRRAGDELLIALAGRLARLVRPEDTLSRLENDTFVMICPHLDDRNEAESRTGKVRLVTNGVFAIFESRVSVSCTVGLLFTGNAADIPAQILDRTRPAIQEARAERLFDSEVIDLRPSSQST